MSRLPLLLLLLVGVAYAKITCNSFERMPDNAVSIPCKTNTCYTATFRYKKGVMTKGGCDLHGVCKLKGPVDLDPKKLEYYFGVKLPAGVKKSTADLACCSKNNCNPKKQIEKPKGK